MSPMNSALSLAPKISLLLLCGVLASWFSSSATAAENSKQSLTTAAVAGENLFLLGTFDSYTADHVIDVLKRHPEIKRIVLTANGGSIDDRDTLRLGRYIRNRGLDSHVIANGVATSGGVSLFLAGKQRSVGSGAFLGVHSWAACPSDRGKSRCKSATEFERDDEAHDLHLDYTFEMLDSGDFYWFSIKSAPHRSIHWLSQDELRRFNVITHDFEADLEIPFEREFLHEYQLTCHNCPDSR